jgi:inositol phosphorylceramide mannosyltransferase catalytic subunit
VLIPRIFHQIWVGPDPMPAEFYEYQQTWLDHHPGWELRFWTEETFPKPEELRRPEAAEKLRAPWERGDIFRLECLWRWGGIHVDTDFECKKSLEPLIESAEFFIGLRKPGNVNGALMGAVAGHPLLERGLAEIRPRESYGLQMGAGYANVKDETGPQFLDNILIGRDDVVFVDPPLFYPRNPKQQEQAYAIHHRMRSWKDAEGLRDSLQKAEKRLHKAQLDAQMWRRRAEKAEARLARLEKPLRPLLAAKRKLRGPKSG